MPIVLQRAIDPVHFGLIMVLNLMIGLPHPLMGLVLFVLARVANLSFLSDPRWRSCPGSCRCCSALCW
jgi:TRAP-type C4-dicarboxylate transport system permease large subunit